MAPEAFLDRLGKAGTLARHTLHQRLDPLGDTPVVEAMRYATSGGKGLRAFLVIESATLFGIPAQKAAPAAAAIEAMHAYSLIHDDLPAMDDDDLRRGQPTVHVKWDEATAILAGDALQSLAFEMIGNLDAAEPKKLTLLTELAKAAGVSGMVGGQAADIAAETAQTPLSLEAITALQAGKTGALFSWSCTAGAILAGSDPKPLEEFAKAFGLAFQIADDVLDATGDEATVGKRLQKDEAAGKATFISHLGLDGAKARASELVAQAKSALEPFGASAQGLKDAADFIVTRDR